MLAEETHSACRELYSMGLSFREISRRLGLSYSTARYAALGMHADHRRQYCECGGEMRRDTNRWRCIMCGEEASKWSRMTAGQRQRDVRRQVNYHVRRRARIREAIHKAKDGPCLDCGVRLPPAAMHFDHVRGIKAFTISMWSQQGRNLEQVMNEIAKCDLRCANCHALRHVAEG